MNQKISKAILLCAIGGLIYTALADPTWWTSRNVIDPSATPDDYVIATAGQLKHIATQAYEELQAQNHSCPGVASIVTSFINDDNYSLINVGQLKNVADPFYDCLGLEKPWTETTTDDDNYALANIGQVKSAFFFTIPRSYFTISGTVTYRGEDTGNIIILVSQRASSWQSAFTVTLAEQGVFTISDIPQGVYSLQAYMDVNGNGNKDAEEPARIHLFSPIQLSSDITGMNLTLEGETVSLCENDEDNDDLAFDEELLHGTYTDNGDSDFDQIPDGWEVKFHLNPMDPADAAYDLDDDGKDNYAEYLANENPRDYECNHDSVSLPNSLNNWVGGSDFRMHFVKKAPHEWKLPFGGLNGDASVMECKVLLHNVTGENIWLGVQPNTPILQQGDQVQLGTEAEGYYENIRINRLLPTSWFNSIARLVYNDETRTVTFDHEFYSCILVNSTNWETYRLAGTFNNWNAYSLDYIMKPYLFHYNDFSNNWHIRTYRYDLVITKPSLISFKVIQGYGGFAKNLGKSSTDDTYMLPSFEETLKPYGEDIQVDIPHAGKYTILYSPRSSLITVQDLNCIDADADNDGLTHQEELELGTDPYLADTNGDGINDGRSTILNISPTNTDHDGDGILNADEINYGTDPFQADTDEDGHNDDVDFYPLDPSAWQTPGTDTGDTTPPVIQLFNPTNAVQI